MVVMNSIIKNTPVSVDQVKQWRKQGTDEEVPLMVAKHNAKVSNLIEELNDIRYTRVIDVDDVNNKIDKLVEIILRGVEFRD
jgi:ssDNA-specific exonuclease RecJ